MLFAEGKSLTDFPEMEQVIEYNEENIYTTLEESMEIGTKQYEQLNNKQKEIVDIVINKLENKNYNSNCFYIDGPGGSGKTSTYPTVRELNVKNCEKVGLAYS